jgi:hypothetical protein
MIGWEGVPDAMVPGSLSERTVESTRDVIQYTDCVGTNDGRSVPRVKLITRG